jgi:2-dehydropantoate 2-reductase
MEFRSIAIVGAGAIGGYYGGRLAQHGRDAHFLLRSDYDAWRTTGLRVRSIHGDFQLRPDQLHVYNSPASMPKVDLVIVTIKSTENHRLPDLIPPLLHDSTTILTLQNGLGNEEALGHLFGQHRIVGGLAFTCINRTAPGEIHHSDYGQVRVGEFFTTGPSERAQAIAEMFIASNIRAEAVDDMRVARWDKQVWNIPFNGLGALLDATTDQLIATDEGTALVRAMMTEVLAAARADGVALPPDRPDEQIARTRTVGAYITSTQLDRRLRKPMEIDAIFARPVAIAHAAGLRLPLLEMLVFSLRLLDQQNRQRNVR